MKIFILIVIIISGIPLRAQETKNSVVLSEFLLIMNKSANTEEQNMFMVTTSIRLTRELKFYI